MFKIAIKFFYLFICLVINNLNAQNYFGDISYKKQLVVSSDDSNSQKESYSHRLYKNFESDFLDLNYTLKFNSEESIFQCEGLIYMDDGPKKSIIIGAGRGSGIYYTNTKNDYRLNEKEAFGALFLITSKISDEKWVLDNQSKMIGNYLCYKATTVYVVKNSKGVFNHPVTAWYTLEIPVGFGPIGYGGLPGLIVELTVQEIKYSVTKVVLNPKKHFEIKKPTKGKLVTEDEFNNIGREAMGNFKTRISN